MASLYKRGNVYWIRYSVNGKRTERSLRTKVLQIAKEKVRRFESAQAQGEDNPLPTRTPIGEIVAAYVQHIRTHKTPKSAQTDVYYLRELFGVCCEELAVTSRRVTEASRKRPIRRGSSRKEVEPIAAKYIEHITTAEVSDFIGRVVRARGLAPKTANRYREIANRLVNWAMKEGRIRMPGGVNPIARVQRYHEPAPEIRFLTLPQIDEQLAALREEPLLQTMVATYIYAGLRREEALWLTPDDVDLSARMIRVQAKTINGESWQPKTRRNRAVPISSDLLRYLIKYRPAPQVSPWFFPSPRGCRWDGDNFSQALARANRRHELRWGCLAYRHSFGSHLARAGVSLYQLSVLMGNSPDICRRHYAHICPTHLAPLIDFVKQPHRHPCVGSCTQGVLRRVGPKNSRSRASSSGALDALVWHSQTTSTSHPDLLRARRFRASRALFSSNFACQNDWRLRVTRLPARHRCRCQKHPCTKTTFRRLRKTMSGRPGKSAACRRNRYPMPWSMRRTTHSGLVSRPLIRDILSLRCRGLSESIQSSVWRSEILTSISRGRSRNSWLSTSTQWMPER